MASEEDKGARTKRGIAPVDYKKLHEGAGLDHVTPGRLNPGRSKSGVHEGIGRRRVRYDCTSSRSGSGRC